MDEMTIDDYLAMEQEQMMEEPDWEEEAALQGQTELPPPPQTKAALVSPVKETTAPMPKIHQSNQSQPSIRPNTVEVTANQVLSGMQPKKKQLNPKEFALAMQEERRKALGSDTSGAGGTPSKSSSAATKMMKLEAESTMFTTQELFVPCLQAARYVHSRPPAIAELIGGSPLPTTTASVTATPAQGYIPCVLADGSKGYLYKRSADSSSAKEARATSSLSSPLPLSARSPASATTAGGLVSCINPPVKTTLLSKPMSELMQEADALKVKALLLKDALMAERTERAERAERVMESDGPALFQASSDAHVEIEAVAGGGDLWVDKYAPRSFTQLLSPEKVNREVLKALKKWDRFVFKTDNHQPGDENGGAPAGGSNALMGFSGSATKPPKATTASAAGAIGLDGAAVAGAGAGEDTRPWNKVILLCGPPGTGKTTLAHIVAKHCGYTPVEVNASDDRSPERLRELIYNATQNATLLAHARPNCVILDEIDGIDGSRNALDALTAIVKAPLKSGSAGSSKGGAKSSFALTRPLICICNDQYAPALRDLIKLADVFVFSAPQDVRLVQRLRQVCKQEGLNVGNSAFIAELCSATGGDIRASINNLQFAALKSKSLQQKQLQQLQEGHSSSRPSANTGSAWGAAFGRAGSIGSTAKAPEAREADTKHLDIGVVLQGMIRSGLKDDSLDLSQIWRQMFTLASTTPPVSSSSTAASGETALEMATIAAKATKALRVDHSMRAMDAMLSYGDHQQVIGGIFENVHSMEALDPNMNRHTAIAEWLSYSDEVNSFMPRARDGFQLMPYVSAVAAAVYSLCAVGANRRPKVEWPRKDKEMHFKGVQKQNILQSFKDGCSIHALHESKQRIVLDVLPHLMDVISPPPGVRALPFITLPAPEQLAILDTVKVMESCGVSYVLSKTIDADTRNKQPFNPYQPSVASVLKLDPAFDQLLDFGECEELASRHPVVTQEMRQLLHTEQRKLSIQLKAHMQSGDAADSAMDVVSTVSSSHTSSAHSSATVGTAQGGGGGGAASTPFLIMQQQQRDSALNKRQHSGVMGSFFAKSTSAAPSSKKSKTAADGSSASASGAAAAAADKKLTFNPNAVRFKFNQGFSNAVKRPVLMDEFL